jgi:hypothetical protein
MLRLVISVALVVATTLSADARKRHVHRAAAKPSAQAMASSVDVPIQGSYSYRYYGGPKGQAWPVPVR